jgi:hypothetical protein
MDFWRATFFASLTASQVLHDWIRAILWQHESPFVWLVLTKSC